MLEIVCELGAFMRAKGEKKDGKIGITGIVGVGLDQKDDSKRVTKSDHFLILGGSAETHERMQDVAIRFEERLKDKGKRLQDTSIPEAMDLLRDSFR